MIHHNFSLRNYNTFRLDYIARTFFSFRSETEAHLEIRDDIDINKPILILGSGSNILFTDNFEGIAIHSEIPGISIEEEYPDRVVISSGSGVEWDSLVEWTVLNGFGGLENLSLIPGSVGAAPVQNIGAYGSEVKDHIEKVRVVEIKTGNIEEFDNEKCEFGYRHSIFKSKLKGSYFITRVFFSLEKRPAYNLSYGSVKEEAEKLGPVSLKTIRQAIINIRTGKLPDPRIIGNAGSFFTNPVISGKEAERLMRKYENIPVYRISKDEVKLAAGWLIEKSGWKGKRIGDTGVYDKQALVLVNYGNATGMEIYDLSEKIRKSVFEEFGISLKREVEVVGST